MLRRHQLSVPIQFKSVHEKLTYVNQCCHCVNETGRAESMHLSSLHAALLGGGELSLLLLTTHAAAAAAALLAAAAAAAAGGGRHTGKQQARLLETETSLKTAPLSLCCSGPSSFFMILGA